MERFFGMGALTVLVSAFLLYLLVSGKIPNYIGFAKK